jgi:phage-related protein
LQARFFALPSGRQPVRDWILELGKDDRVIVGKDIQKVEFGWPIGMPSCKALGSGLYEVRSDISGGRIGRVMFCIAKGEMVLLHGFVKKSQKAPAKDIELARSRQKEIM